MPISHWKNKSLADNLSVILNLSYSLPSLFWKAKNQQKWLICNYKILETRSHILVGKQKRHTNYCKNTCELMQTHRPNYPCSYVKKKCLTSSNTVLTHCSSDKYEFHETCKQDPYSVKLTDFQFYGFSILTNFPIIWNNYHCSFLRILSHYYSCALTEKVKISGNLYLGGVKNEAFSLDSCNESQVIWREGTVSVKWKELEILPRNTHWGKKLLICKVMKQTH